MKKNFNKIDAMGKQCPIPLVMLKNSINEHGQGTYQISVDNKIAVENITKLCKQFKYDFKYEQNDKEFLCIVGVGQKAIIGADTADSNATPQIACGELNDVFVFDSNVLGNGDNKLGAILIKGFIFSLSQEAHAPKTIICYKSGVKLVCEGSESLQDFKVLADKGTDIIACGTCLDFYGLTEKIQVGRVGNMYDIVNTLNAANKVVQP